MKKQGVLTFFKAKQYVIAGALVLVAAVSMTVVYSNEQAKERRQLEQQVAEKLKEEQQLYTGIAAESPLDPDPEPVQAASSVVKPKPGKPGGREETEETEQAEGTEQAEQAKETELTEQPEQENPSSESAAKNEDKAEEKSEKSKKTMHSAEPTLHFSENTTIQWPMDGNVIINYSMDSTVYFATLDQYKCNPGIVIAGDVNNKVYSVAKGKIKSIEKDEVTGTTVTVDLGDGYSAIYGQLKELNFKEGDLLEPGHVIGYVSEPTKYFAVEGSNLYFAMQKDGTPIDPIEFFE